jgi:two-component system cell cycle sensor histidine kinase/response regulator CckA
LHWYKQRMMPVFDNNREYAWCSGLEKREKADKFKKPRKQVGKKRGLQPGHSREEEEKSFHRDSPTDAQVISDTKSPDILENIDTAYFELDLKGNFIFFNDIICNSLGYTRKELMGVNFRTYTKAVNAELIQHIFQEIYRTGKPKTLINFEVFRKDGSSMIIDHSISLMRGPTGEAIGFRGVARDITDRIRAEKLLRESEEKYRTVLETMEEGLFEFDLKGNTTFVNDAACRLTGYDRDELIGMDYRKRFPPETARLMKKIYNRIYETGKPEFIMDYEIIRKDGSIRTLQSNVALIRDAAGQPKGFRTLVRDVTDRKKAEEALGMSEDRYRMIVENIHETIWSMDHDLRYTYISPSIFRISGYTAYEMQNIIPLSQQMTPESHALALQVVDEELAKEQLGGRVDSVHTRILELEMYHKSGGTYWAEVTGTFNRDENGKIIRIVGVTRDITERKTAEIEKKRLEGQLLQAQKMESVGRLAGGVAHDFNNMLTVIHGYAEMIKSRLPQDDPIFRDVLEIEKAASHSRDLTRQLLAFSRKQIIEPKLMDLNALISGTEKILSRLIGTDIDLRFYPGKNIWKIMFDHSQLEHILVNLVANARDAMTNGGKLTIETENIHLNEAYCKTHLGFLPGYYVLLGVSDDGAGMDREILQHVFEPFFTTKETGRGTGLGLATVYGIVKQNNGFINVYSEPGKGTTFKIYIPRSIEQGEVVEEAAEEAPVSGTGTILLVEDEDMVRQITTEMLESIGYKVVATGDPRDALSFLGKGGTEFELVITDVVMPGMSGNELRTCIESVRPGTKLLFISGYTSNVILHRGVLEEGVHFIQKPFSISDLARKVSEAINGNR